MGSGMNEYGPLIDTDYYGPVPEGVWSGLKAGNVPPALFDELVDYFGRNDWPHLMRYVAWKGRDLGYGDVLRDRPAKAAFPPPEPELPDFSDEPKQAASGPENVRAAERHYAAGQRAISIGNNDGALAEFAAGQLQATLALVKATALEAVSKRIPMPNAVELAGEWAKVSR